MSNQDLIVHSGSQVPVGEATSTDLDPSIYYRGEHIIVVSPVRLPDYEKKFQVLRVHMEDIKPFIKGLKAPHHYRIVKGQILTKWQAFLVKLDNPKWHELQFIDELSPDCDIGISINPKKNTMIVQCNLHRSFRIQEINMLKEKSKHRVLIHVTEKGNFNRLLKAYDFSLSDLLERKRIEVPFDYTNFSFWTNWRAGLVETVMTTYDPFTMELHTNMYELSTEKNPDCWIELDYRSIILERNELSGSIIPKNIKLMITGKDNPYMLYDWLNISLTPFDENMPIIINLEYETNDKTFWIVNETNVVKYFCGLKNADY